jgi:hypothetical protein
MVPLELASQCAEPCTANKTNASVEGKRSRIETETGNAGSEMNHPRPAGLASEAALASTRSSGSSPQGATLLHMQSGFQRPSTSASASGSPAVRSESLNSPARADSNYSPETGPGASSVAFRTREHELSRGSTVGRMREPPSLQQQYSSSSQSASYSPSLGQRQDSYHETTPTQTGYMAPVPRRESRGGSPQIPSLVHQDSTLSGESISHPLPPPSLLLPAMDTLKQPNRVLPQPVPSIGHRSSPLDPRALPGISPQILPLAPPNSGQDPMRASNWPALLRASELAREAQWRGGEQRQGQDEPPVPRPPGP